VEEEPIAVAREHEGHIERRGVGQRLLHAAPMGWLLSFASTIASGRLLWKKSR